MKTDTSIEHTLTVETLKGAYHLDWNKLYEKKEQDLDTIRRLLSKNNNDKNVQAVFSLMEKELKDMEEIRKEWLLHLGLKPHHDFKIVILVQEDE